MADTLAEMTFDEVVNFGTKEILERVLSGKDSLRSAVYGIVDVSARWSRETLKKEQQKDELSKRRQRRQNS